MTISKTFYRILFAFSLLFGVFNALAFGLELSQIQSTMTQNIQKTLEILQKTPQKIPKILQSPLRK